MRLQINRFIALFIGIFCVGIITLPISIANQIMSCYAKGDKSAEAMMAFTAVLALTIATPFWIRGAFRFIIFSESARAFRDAINPVQPVSRTPVTSHDPSLE